MNGQCFYCEGGQTWQNKRRGKGGNKAVLYGAFYLNCLLLLWDWVPPALWVPSPTSDTPVNFYL